MRNKVQFIGNLTKDVEVKTDESGSKYAMFGLAVNESYKDKNGNKQEHTEFMDCIVRGNVAEVLGKYGSKGKKIGVVGKVRTKVAQDGRKFTNYIINEVELLGVPEKQEEKPTTTARIKPKF